MAKQPSVFHQVVTLVSAVIVCTIFSIVAGAYLAKWGAQLDCDEFNKLSQYSKCKVTWRGTEFKKIVPVKLIKA